MPIIAWLLSKLTAKLALPLLAGLLLTNIVTGAGLVITRHTLADRTRDLAAEVKAHTADLATFDAATKQAQANDMIHAATVQKAQDQISTEKQHDLETQLASVRAAAARFVRANPAPINHGSISQPPVSYAANTAAAADGAPASTIISASDADDCAVAFTVAKGWQDWWTKENAVDVSAAARPDMMAQADEASGGRSVVALGSNIGRVLGDNGENTLAGTAIALGKPVRTPGLIDVVIAGAETGHPDQDLKPANSQNSTDAISYVNSVHKYFLP